MLIKNIENKTLIIKLMFIQKIYGMPIHVKKIEWSLPQGVKRSLI